MKDIKNIPLLLIPYLTICGALYHISYWETFGLNGLSFISASDILKSAIYPIMKSFYLILPLTIGQFVANKNKILFEDDIIFDKSWQLKLFYMIWFATTIYIYYSDIEIKWQILPFIASILPAIYLFESKIFNDIILTPSNRFSIIYLLIFILIFSFTSGKHHSENILNNHSFQYVKIKQSPTEQIVNIKSDTLKFLGSSEQNLYLLNMNNSEILIIKNNNIDTLILIDKK